MAKLLQRTAAHRAAATTVAALFILTVVHASAAVRTGADRLFEEPYSQWIRGKRVGLITNTTGVDVQLRMTMNNLSQHAEVKLVAVFAPEHGLFGQAQAGVHIEGYGNVYSLYGETRSPTREMLQDVDVLLYDIQDVGVRFYTYISTLFMSMKAAAQNSVPVVVLDRPNPITGSRSGGPVLEDGFESFVGIYRLPIRYGMTIGELARLMNEEARLGCDLRVVPLEGWSRGQWYDQSGLPWVSPSPNIPTLETATVYPGFCLIEGSNLSEGRGTTRPFEFIGAPWLDAQKLMDVLNELGLPGVHFRRQSFTPSFSKYRGEVCNGVQVHVLDRESFEPIRTVLYFFEQVRRLHPDRFELDERRFNRLAGNQWVRESLLKGDPVDQIIERWQSDLRQFESRRKKYLLYETDH